MFSELKRRDDTSRRDVGGRTAGVRYAILKGKILLSRCYNLLRLIFNIRNLGANSAFVAVTVKTSDTFDSFCRNVSALQVYYTALP